ncbi:MAG: hypothetical protein H8E84_04185 [Flavobacteriales bacterium]|nr:hypothetical protein [Flavobacteriales bacterium]
METKEISKKGLRIWRALQVLLFILGIGFLTLMLNDSLRFIPSLPESFGRDAFWNVLIFAAPLLFAVAPGVWRNICPMGTTSLFARYLGISKAKQQDQKQQGIFYLISVILLYVLVPLRHVETSGLSVVIALVGVGVLALILGYLYQGKSGWCSGLCPVFPVEKLYGSKPLVTVPNTHCSTCVNCISPCADSTDNITPSSNQESAISRFASFIFVGGFPGFVWGWFNVADFPTRMEGWANLDEVYGLPMLGFSITLFAYWILRRLFEEKDYTKVALVFAAAAISCYYWYRIPSILGLTDASGVFGLDLSEFTSLKLILRIISTLFFFWWIVLRNTIKSWEYRPKFEELKTA